MTTLTSSGIPTSHVDDSLSQDITLQHPDIWGRTQGTSTLKIKPGASWAQWQLSSYCKKNKVPDSFPQKVAYAEWLPGGMPEGYLDVLRTLACGSPSHLHVAEASNLAELFMFPRNEQDKKDAQVIVNAVLTLRHPLAPGVPRRGEVAYKEMAYPVAEVLERHVKPAYRNQARSDWGMILLDIRYSERHVEKVTANVRAIMFFSLVARLGEALRHDRSAGAELGFLREISQGELTSLRLLHEQLDRGVREDDGSVAAHPLADLVGFMAPERLLSLASLVEEFNMEWALAAMEWGTPVGAESRERKNP